MQNETNKAEATDKKVEQVESEKQETKEAEPLFKIKVKTNLKAGPTDGNVFEQGCIR